jgi:ABC-type phosphate/phosphonate transport system ATPase subunit
MYDGKIVYDGMVDDITDADFEKIYGGQLTEEDYNETRTN